MDDKLRAIREIWTPASGASSYLLAAALPPSLAVVPAGITAFLVSCTFSLNGEGWNEGEKSMG
jgi:hypothetical protein